MVGITPSRISPVSEPLSSLGKADKILHFAKNGLRFGQQFPARGRDQHRFAVALENRNAQLLLQFPHRRAQGGLGDKTGFRRLAEVPVFGHRNEVSELSDGGCHRLILIEFAHSVRMPASH